MATLIESLPSVYDTAQFVVGLFVCWGVVRFVWRRWKYDLHRLPGAPELPLLGHIKYLSLNKPQLHLVQYKWCREFGDIFRINLVGKIVTIVNNPDTVRRDVTANGSRDMPKSELYGHLDKLFSPTLKKNILTVLHADERYRTQRKALATAFSTSQMKKVFPRIMERATALGDFVARSKGESLDVESVFGRYVFDALGVFAYDTNFRAIESEGHPLLNALKVGMDEAMADALFPPRPVLRRIFPFTKSARTAKQAFNELYGYYATMADKVIKGAGFYAEDDASLAASLAKLWQAKELSMEEVCSQIGAIFVAGVDTTAHTLTYALCLLAEHPHVQSKLRKEIENHGLGAKSGKKLTYQDLSQVKYLGYVVTEVLRYFPAVPYLSRQASQDITLNGYRIPKGVIVGVTPLALNRAKPFENPDEFWPERWDGEASIKAGNHYTFSIGTRDCIGRALAILELQLAVIELIRRFEVTFDPRMGGWSKIERESYGSIAVAIDGGAWLKFTPLT